LAGHVISTCSVPGRSAAVGVTDHGY
jgi:hypothetical protein